MRFKKSGYLFADVDGLLEAGTRMFGTKVWEKATSTAYPISVDFALAYKNKWKG